MRWNTVWIAIGSNVGDSTATVNKAVAQLQAHPALRNCCLSPHYRSKPQGPEQRAFINAALRLETTLSAMGLLDCLQSIEQLLGRVQRGHWQPRELDLDMIAYADLRIHHPRLKLPHPLFSQRDFVLRPLLDICPNGIIANIHLQTALDQVPHRYIY